MVGAYRAKFMRILKLARYNSIDGSERFPRDTNEKIIGTIPSRATPSHNLAENVVTVSKWEKNKIVSETFIYYFGIHFWYEIQ